MKIFRQDRAHSGWSGRRLKIFNIFSGIKNTVKYIYFSRKLPIHTLTKLNFMLGPQREHMSGFSYGEHGRSSINAREINKLAW